MRVLIAEDDPQIRAWLLRAMLPLGHDAEAVGDAAALLRRVEDFDPDLVLTDADLPGRDGIAAGLALKRTRPRCRIVLMSGDVGRADAARLAGFAGVLDKPFSLDELAAALAPRTA